MFELLKSVFADNPNVVLLGFGREGRSTYKFLRKYFPDMNLGIADANTDVKNDNLIIGDNNLHLHLGKDYQQALLQSDIIFKSPGVKIDINKSVLEATITSQTDLFLQRYAKQVIGVTGTKGKSTTVSLIKHMLDADKRDSILLGNIGVPAFDMIDNIVEQTIVVYELSAHQLEYLHRSPHVSVLLNIFPEHLDYFNVLSDYITAKENIYRYQSSGDVIICSNSLNINKTLSDNRIITVDSGNLNFEIENSPLLGYHNLFNIRCALLAVSNLGVNENTAINSLDTFKNLPHRLENIGSYGAIQFVNDSISTVPESTIAAINAIGNVDILILGGFDRGLNYNELVEFLSNSQVDNFVFLGEAGTRMFNLMKDKKGKKLFKAKTIEDVFDIIKINISEGKVCLLSPAAASYDQFKNFEHRGDKFTSLARKYQ